jgi:hypothetical protein
MGFGALTGFFVAWQALAQRVRKTKVKLARTDQIILRVLRVPSVSSVRDPEAKFKIIRFPYGETALVSRFEPWLP